MKQDDLKARLREIAEMLFEDAPVRSMQVDQAVTTITDLEALVDELGEALKRFVSDFETDFCIEGVIVDDPDPMLKTHYVLARATLAKARAALEKDQTNG